MYVFTDERNRITAYNGVENLPGNDNWHEVVEIIGEPITNEVGVPLYTYSKGHVISRTAAEIDADTPDPVEPTPDRLDVIEQRLDEQDDALIELAEMIAGGE